MFRNRGNLSDIFHPTINDNTGNGGFRAPHYFHFWNGRFIIIRYDKTFVAIEIIALLLILSIVIAVYLFAYQIPFEDPISEIKNTFLNIQFGLICISIFATALVTFFTKSNKENLIKNLRLVAILSILAIIIFIGVKIYIDTKYNETTFEEFYEQYKQTESVKNLPKFSFNVLGFKVSDTREFYIEESINAYTNFTIKVVLYFIIHILFVFLIFYLSNRLSTIENKKEKLMKDDVVLYDDEENIKF